MPKIDIAETKGDPHEVLCSVSQEKPFIIEKLAETLFVTVSDESLKGLLPVMKEAFRSGVKEVGVSITPRDNQEKARNVVFVECIACEKYFATWPTECVIFQKEEE